MTSAGEQQIDLGTFYHEFIRPGRGSASVTGEFDDAAGKARLIRVLEAIEKNRRNRSEPASAKLAG